MAANIFQDIKQTDNELAYTTGGDFSFTASDETHIIDIMMAYQGEWKQYPACGVGIMDSVNSSGQEQAISREIRLQLTADGYTVKTPDYLIEKNRLTVAPHAVR